MIAVSSLDFSGSTLSSSSINRTTYPPAASIRRNVADAVTLDVATLRTTNMPMTRNKVLLPHRWTGLSTARLGLWNAASWA